MKQPVKTRLDKQRELDRLEEELVAVRAKVYRLRIELGTKQKGPGITRPPNSAI